MVAFARSDRELLYREEALWLLPVACMAAVLLLAAQIAGAQFGLSPWTMLAGYSYKALRLLPLALCAAVTYQVLRAIMVAPTMPLTEFVNRNRGIFSNPWLLAARVAPLLLMPIVFVGFSSLKMLMPQFIRFWLDDNFAAMDRVLFFGRQPWVVTHALFGSFEATVVIDKLYTLWVLLLSLAIVTVALFAPRPDRARFFLAFTAAWLVLGVGGAWLGASAGPCYSALIGAKSAPEFAGLVDRLHDFSLASRGALGAPAWQDILWRSHSTESYGFGMGISAMPSLHNAIATLYALAAFRLSRAFGWLMTGYAVLIFVGSIHLGWHYAIDGPVGALGMLVIWRAVDAWCRRSGYDAAIAGTDDRLKLRTS